MERKRTFLLRKRRGPLSSLRGLQRGAGLRALFPFQTSRSCQTLKPNPATRARRRFFYTSGVLCNMMMVLSPADALRFAADTTGGLEERTRPIAMRFRKYMPAIMNSATPRHRFGDVTCAIDDRLNPRSRRSPAHRLSHAFRSLRC